MGWNIKIKQARQALGMTQEQLANRLSVHRSTIANYELARRKPTFIELKKIAEILCVDVNYLVEDAEINSANELLNRAKIVFSDSDMTQEEKDALFIEISNLYIKEKEIYESLYSDEKLEKKDLSDEQKPRNIESLIEKDLPSLKIIQKSYWTVALDYLHEQFGEGCFSNVNPSENSYISGYVGINGVKITCSISKDDFIKTEVRIDRSDASFNKKLFDILFNKKDDIEKELKTTLLWNRNDNKVSSNIAIKLDNVSLKNERDWDKMAKFHSEWAKRFYDVVIPVLKDMEY